MNRKNIRVVELSLTSSHPEMRHDCRNREKREWQKVVYVCECVLANRKERRVCDVCRERGVGAEIRRLPVDDVMLAEQLHIH